MRGQGPDHWWAPRGKRHSRSRLAPAISLAGESAGAFAPRSSPLTSPNLAYMRSERVFRFSRKLPRRDLPQMKVKPRKVEGFRLAKPALDVLCRGNIMSPVALRRLQGSAQRSSTSEGRCWRAAVRSRALSRPRFNNGHNPITRTQAASHFWISRMTRGSPTRCFRNRTSQFEEDFLGFSYGFRPRPSQHDALDALMVGITMSAQHCCHRPFVG